MLCSSYLSPGQALRLRNFALSQVAGTRTDYLVFGRSLSFAGAPKQGCDLCVNRGT